MPKKKWRRTSAYTITVIRTINRIWFSIYCKFWKLLGWSPIVVTVYCGQRPYNRFMNKFGISQVVSWDRVCCMNKEIETIGELYGQDTIEDNSKRYLDDDWVEQAFLNAYKIEVPEGYK